MSVPSGVGIERGHVSPIVFMSVPSSVGVERGHVAACPIRAVTVAGAAVTSSAGFYPTLTMQVAPRARRVPLIFRPSFPAPHLSALLAPTSPPLVPQDARAQSAPHARRSPHVSRPVPPTIVRPLVPQDARAQSEAALQSQLAAQQLASRDLTARLEASTRQVSRSQVEAMKDLDGHWGDLTAF